LPLLELLGISLPLMKSNFRLYEESAVVME